MPLKLNIISYQRLSPGQETTQILDRGSISIGRASKNDWILQDPERILSSEHCVVHYKDGGYVLTDKSTNGTFLNDSEQRIPREHTVPLNDGDRFVLGEYEIEATLCNTEEEAMEAEGPVTDIVLNPGLAAADIHKSEKAPPPLAEASLDIIKPPFNDLLAESRDSLGLEHSNPEQYPPGGAATEPSSDLGGPEGAAYEPPELLAPEELLPPAGPSEPLAAPPTPPLPSSLFAEGPADHPPSEPIASAEPSIEMAIPDDWWKTPAAPTPETHSAAPEPSLAPLFQQPPASPPQPEKPPASPPRPEPPVKATQSTELDAQALLFAFLNGAGLPQMRLTDEQLPEVMANLGAIFHETVRGLMEILLARGDLKGEFRLDRTAIGPVENNPLKTPPGQPPLRVEEVMALLLISQKGAGYMPPVQAVHEGFDDIKAHQMAVMAGIQAALSRLLERFDPGNLETRLGQSVLDNIWPANRKAKYWDLFNAEYQTIAREAEDDFNELFGDEFARAYEEKLRSY